MAPLSGVSGFSFVGSVRSDGKTDEEEISVSSDRVGSCGLSALVFHGSLSEAEPLSVRRPGLVLQSRLLSLCSNKSLWGRWGRCHGDPASVWFTGVSVWLQRPLGLGCSLQEASFFHRFQDCGSCMVSHGDPASV